MQYPCFTLARVLHDLKDYEQVLKYYDKTIELYEEYAQAYINRGNTKINLKMIEEAIEDFDLAAKYYQERARKHDFAPSELAEPEHAVPYGFYHLGNSLYEIDKYDEALEDSELVVKYYKKQNNTQDYVNSLFQRAWIKSKLERFQEAMDEYNDLIKTYKDYIDLKDYYLKEHIVQKNLNLMKN
ncbi:TPA: hypothetical protein RXJ07_001413 [Campylobacter lari]|nr:hypothetical protein [Campylobacter lari]